MTATPAPKAPAPTPHAAPTIKPTPTQYENDMHALAVAAGSLPHVVIHQPDGSPQVDPEGPPLEPTWPEPA
jgi:hypothetical protein